MNFQQLLHTSKQLIMANWQMMLLLAAVAIVVMWYCTCECSQVPAVSTLENPIVEELTNFELAAKQFGDQDDKIRDARKHHYLVFGKQFKDVKSNLLQ